MNRGSWLLVVLALIGAACTDSASTAATGGSGPETEPASLVGTAGDGGAGEEATEEQADGADEPTPAPTSTAAPVEVVGIVRSAVDGSPLATARVSAGSTAVVTGADGRFVLTVPAGSTLVVERPVWGSVEVPVPAAPGEDLVVELQPMVVRGLRVAKEVARDRIRFDELLALTEGTTVNTLVFDTKDETNVVLYDTEVEFAHDIGAVEDVYDPAELLALAREHDLYAVTRIVTFEDGGWAQARPEAKLAGSWVDAGNEDNWAYPLALAEEACALGFDEVQFDYVRFPAGRTAEAAASRLPPTSDARADVIARFLTEARDRLHPMGCGVSAAIFGIVMSSETDEGIGQTPETVSSAVDAVSPMLYPSHYGPGWLGFADPNDHPGPVIAHALDTGEPKVESNVLIRPWIQGFDYNGQQVQAQITESEARGAGWIIWNYPGNYRRDWLPSA